MSVAFNAEEVLEIAKRIEKNGTEFYRGARERAEDPLTRQLFDDLARMEEEHQATFDAMLRERKKAGSLEVFFDPDREGLKILHAWADGTVFDVNDEMGPPLKGKEPMDEILKTAIQAEKDSVVFYQGIKEAIQSPEDLLAVDEVIREEMKHITLLSEALTRSQS